MEYLLNELDRQQLLDLLPDGLTLLLIKSAQALVHRFGTSSDVQGVLGDFSRYAWPVRGTQQKHVSVRVEKVDEHCFLFGIEAGTDPQCLAFGGLGVEENVLGLLHQLETCGMALGVRDVLSEAVEVGDQGHRLHYGLSLLNALDVALVGVLALHADGDDAIGA